MINIMSDKNIQYFLDCLKHLLYKYVSNHRRIYKEIVEDPENIVDENRNVWITDQENNIYTVIINHNLNTRDLICEGYILEKLDEDYVNKKSFNFEIEFLNENNIKIISENKDMCKFIICEFNDDMIENINPKK